jgi:lipid-A-disaccharide synthase
MRYYFVVGEASGDLHASNLIKALKQRDTQAEIRAWGGDLMQAAGATVVKHYRELAFMGFTEVVANLRTILRNMRLCREDITAFRPDALVLVDYPGFNLRMARFAHQAGIPVHYYISPQIWAWKQGRVKQVRDFVDQMYVILPFEKDFYARFGVSVHFVGHPLLDALPQAHQPTAQTAPPFGESLGNAHSKPVVAILPGSRKQEISRMLPVMLRMVPRFPQYDFVVAAAPSQDLDYYRHFIGTLPVQVVQGDTYGLLARSHAAMVTSGTATLETALLGVPQVVCYKGGALSYRIARALVKVKYISLVNLIMDREVVRELIQQHFREATLEEELTKLCTYSDYRQAMGQSYAALREKLGGSGASQRTAVRMLEALGKRQNHK